ncbi:zinc-binding dehydrogenase [Olivibacter jilunii]|uniref:zinc-binding dehydrogenase n=1 Tax=Olivibacter jilunii TaxID=985016 RepID=UPI003BF7ABA6
MLANPEVLQSAVAFISDGIESGKPDIVISRTLGLDEIVAATRFMESNSHVGKIVVKI